jgi:hypothetical protein
LFASGNAGSASILGARRPMSLIELVLLEQLRVCPGQGRRPREATVLRAKVGFPGASYRRPELLSFRT